MKTYKYEGVRLPPKAVRTIQDLIFWQYAKIISESTGYGKKQFGFVMDRFKKLSSGEISWSGSIREYVKEREKKSEIPRGKHHNKTATKTTVSLYLSKNLLKKARNHRLNLSRITEQALYSILDYLETQNSEKCSVFLGKAPFPKEGLVDGAGFEPAASTMPTWRSYQADLPAQRPKLLKL